MIADREGDLDDGESDFAEAAEEMYEVAANLMLFLAALPVAGVVLESRVLRRTLAAVTLVGKQRR